MAPSTTDLHATPTFVIMMAVGGFQCGGPAHRLEFEQDNMQLLQSTGKWSVLPAELFILLWKRKAWLVSWGTENLWQLGPLSHS